jgi:arylformamidase
MKIHDISLKISEDMIVYPGNPIPSIKSYAEISRDRVKESIIVLGSHTGTHVDSKSHIIIGGEESDNLPLGSFYGMCKVFDLTHIYSEIHDVDLEEFEIVKGDIILLKTRNSLLGYKKFRKDFVHLKLDAAEYLVKANVKTLGFDYLSVKKFGGDPEVHELLISNLTLFEGLNLTDIHAGKYIFVGLPLNISCDGVPARVIIIEN